MGWSGHVDDRLIVWIWSKLAFWWTIKPRNFPNVIPKVRLVRCVRSFLLYILAKDLKRHSSRSASCCLALMLFINVSSTYSFLFFPIIKWSKHIIYQSLICSFCILKFKWPWDHVVVCTFTCNEGKLSLGMPHSSWSGSMHPWNSTYRGQLLHLLNNMSWEKEKCHLDKLY